MPDASPATEEPEEIQQPEGPRICVVAPEPMVTVTVEQDAEDQPEIHFHPGGQGFWVARMVRTLGAIPVLCGPFGGETGTVLRALLRAEAIEVEAVEIEQSNGGYLHDRRNGDREAIADMPPARLSRHEVDDFYNAALGTGLDAGVVVLTGIAADHSISPEFIARLAADLAGNDVRVVADVSGNVLEQLEAAITVIKVSQKELVQSGLARERTTAEVLRGARTLQARGVEHVVITRAEEPALAVIDGRAFEVHPPRFEPLDHHGAGDSMTAAIAVGVGRGLDPEETLRLGAAAGALNVTRHGLGSGRRKNIEQLTEKVEIVALD